ncbi:MAG: glutamate racemase [Oscillospiraceae bacterium]|nr:glutamate racemase [Oscillospiraceae bacterium]
MAEMNDMNSSEKLLAPIAVFDSGMGGVSVLKELRKLLPNENFIFFGDSKNAPYGTKTKSQVLALCREHLNNFLREGCKALVIACNTATSAAVWELREDFPDFPIVGIEPAVKPAALSGEHPRILVMATPMTIREEKLRRLIEEYEDRAEIISLPCPGLMEFAERGELHGKDLNNYLCKLLSPYRDKILDGIVLGCTHYPFLKDEIAAALPYPVTFFDGAEGTARELRRRLEELSLSAPKEKKGTITFRCSLPGEEKEALFGRLLNE